MARAGAQVVVNDLGVDLVGADATRSAADAVVEEIQAEGGVAIADYSDIADDAAVDAMLKKCIAHFGALDALVNNAAIEHRGSIESHTSADWDRVLAVNARGAFNCSRHAAAVMMSQEHGSILNTTSGSFWAGTGGVCAYSASKAAVFSLTLSLHTELSPHGIRANCIAPNATRTRMVESWIEQLSGAPEAAGKGEEQILAEWGIQQPDNLAPLAIALCSDATRGISGKVFEVCNDSIHLIEPPSRGLSLDRQGERWTVDGLCERLPDLLQRSLERD